MWQKEVKPLSNKFWNPNADVLQLSGSPLCVPGVFWRICKQVKVQKLKNSQLGTKTIFQSLRHKSGHWVNSSSESVSGSLWNPDSLSAQLASASNQLLVARTLTAMTSAPTEPPTLISPCSPGDTLRRDCMQDTLSQDPRSQIGGGRMEGAVGEKDARNLCSWKFPSENSSD